MQIITGFEIPRESVKRVVEAGIARQRQVTHRRPVGAPADCEPSGSCIHRCGAGDEA